MHLVLYFVVLIRSRFGEVTQQTNIGTHIYTESQLTGNKKTD
jgi:hypothetical protein